MHFFGGLGVGVGRGGQLMSINPFKLQFRLESFTSAPLGASDPWASKTPAGSLRLPGPFFKVTSTHRH